MKGFLSLVTAVLVLLFMVFDQVHALQKGVCLQVSGERIEVHNLGSTPLVIDREGIPDFAATSMLESVSTGKGAKSYNLLLTKLKRNPQKTITSFELKVDEKIYFYPQDACAK